MKNNELLDASYKDIARFINRWSTKNKVLSKVRSAGSICSPSNLRAELFFKNPKQRKKQTILSQYIIRRSELKVAKKKILQTFNESFVSLEMLRKQCLKSLEIDFESVDGWCQEIIEEISNFETKKVLKSLADDEENIQHALFMDQKSSNLIENVNFVCTVISTITELIESLVSMGSEDSFYYKFREYTIKILKPIIDEWAKIDEKIWYHGLNDTPETKPPSPVPMNLSNLIQAQSCIRGYLARNQVSEFKNCFQDLIENNLMSISFSRDSRDAEEESKLNSQPFPSAELNPDLQVLEYSAKLVESIENNLGPYKPEYFFDDPQPRISRDALEIQEENAIYQGEWNEEDKRHGFGLQIFSDNSTYEGFWRNGMRDGEGRFICADGTVYEGNWRNNKKHGNGKEIWIDGTKYEGSYVDDKKVGFGRFAWVDGSTYEGNVYEGIIQGKGIYRWSDGKVYEGNWKDGKMYGLGKFYWPDGRTYEGQFVEDVMHGHGTLIWPDGRRYEGSWLKGKQNGKGFYWNSKGIKKESEWKDGKRMKKHSKWNVKLSD
ncbi:unnamed protein product [Blepharisma stoltei]|uniref:Uncharacterized protein n=1 Tax=Blepharisma stoltei TaxID=1481888 RepID=A0AAU9J1H4_9CILI|nr:unnamed protein product [Blepharisma stoltei]